MNEANLLGLPSFVQAERLKDSDCFFLGKQFSDQVWVKRRILRWCATGNQLDASIALNCDLNAPPIRQQILRLFGMSYSNNQEEIIKNPAVQRQLARQSIQRITIALQFVSIQRAVDNRDVNSSRTRPDVHLLDNASVNIMRMLDCKPSLNGSPNIRIAHGLSLVHSLVTSFIHNPFRLS